MSVVDLEMSAKAGAMEDLRNSRQDELPLSNQTRHGPSYAPSGNNGTNHINPQLKGELKNKWSAPIEDEESRQMEGLEIGDSRPWDKRLAKRINDSGKVHTRVLAPHQRPNTNKRPKQDNNPALAPARQTFQFKTVNRDWQATVQSMSAVVPQATMTTPVKAPQMRAPKRPAEPDTKDDAEDVEKVERYDGECLATLGNDKSKPLLVKFSLTVSENHALFLLESPNLPRRVYNVLELKAPTIKSNTCYIETNNTTYCLQLSNWIQAEQLRCRLHMAQQASMSVKPPVESPVAPTSQHATNAPMSSKVQAPVAKQEAEVHPPINLLDEPVSGRRDLGPLIDFGSNESSEAQGAVAQFSSLALRLVNMLNFRQTLTAEEVQHMQDAAMQYWLARNPIHVSEGEIMITLLDIFKKIIQLHLQIKNNGHRSRASRLTYSQEEIQRLRVSAASCPSTSASCPAPSASWPVTSSSRPGGQDAPITPAETGTTKIQRRPTKGLSHSRWATT